MKNIFTTGGAVFAVETEKITRPFSPVLSPLTPGTGLDEDFDLGFDVDEDEDEEEFVI